MRPNPWLAYNRPDEIAECWDGVSESLYKALWDMVEHYKPRKGDIEDMCPQDEVGVNSTAKFWSKFSGPHKCELNRLAVREAKRHA